VRKERKAERSDRGSEVQVISEEGELNKKGGGRDGRDLNLI